MPGVQQTRQRALSEGRGAGEDETQESFGRPKEGYALLRSCLASRARMRCCFSWDRLSMNTLPTR